MSLQIETVQISDLKPHPRNPRVHPESALARIQKSIETYGWTNPVLVSKDGTILAGHARVKTAQKMGLTEVPVLRLPLSGEMADAYLVADNRLAELTEWDDESLATLLAELTASLDDIEVTGFGADEVNALLDQFTEYAQEDSDVEIPKPPADPITQAGDLWQLGRHRLLCGDSTKAEDVGRLMDSATVHAVLTDPPYQMYKDIANDALGEEDFSALHLAFMEALPAVQNATMACFHSTRTFPVALDAARVLGWTFDRMLWMYKPNDMTFPWRGWILKSEAILMFSRGRGSWNEVHPYQHDVYTFNHTGGELAGVDGWHPTVKPLAVVLDVLERICGATERVYDPFGGSGTTMVAAETLGRIAYVMELDPKYCDVIIARWERLTGQKAKKVMPDGTTRTPE